jgi:uncharacterized protein (TIGR00297 family)
MSVHDYLPVLLLMTAALLSIMAGKLTWMAGMLGAVEGYFIFMGAGYTGLLMLGAFFLLGSASTSWQYEKKRLERMEEKNKGRRNAGQVWANGGMAALLGVAAFVFSSGADCFRLSMAAAISAATADTLSSELGMVYGKRFYDILHLKPSVKGRNGVISTEGTLLGFAGSLIITLVYTTGFGWNWFNVILILVAGTLGNVTDSYLGAWLENKGRIGNNAVNFLCTLAAAAVAGIGCLLR